MSLIEKSVDAYKEGKKAVKKVKNAIKFFLTPVGHVVGILLLVIVAILLLGVMGLMAYHAWNMWWDDDYAGLATTEDYETIMSEMGTAGYDSFLSEEKWQEFTSFEYEVLMDVADHMYEYQDYVIEVEDNGEKTYTSAVFPEGTVKSEYDAYEITRDEWRNMVVSAQGGGKPEVNNSTEVEKLGGNRDVVPPRVIYEIAGHEYQENAVSLMPYLVIVRENLELNYFFQDLTKSKNYEHLEEINPSDLQTVNPVRFSAELNRYNYDMPNSAYKKDLEEDQEKELVVGIEDSEGFIDADRDDVGYGCDVYYTEQENDIVYKIPLKLVVNRYLPKASLLSSWYTLKTKSSGDEGFKVDEMMDSIKQIYSSACYKEGMDEIEKVTAKHKKDENGKIVSASSVGLRTGKEDFTGRTIIKDAIQYTEYGSIKRDEEGNPELKDKGVIYPTSNKRTFIYFEQFGLETTRYEKIKAYTSQVGDKAENDEIDEARPNPESAVATYLTREKNNFVQALNIQVEVTYINDLGFEATKTVYPHLKPTYSHMDEPGVPLFEKSKILYLYGTSTGGVNIEQEAPYNFMKEARRRAEAKMGNRPISKLVPGGEEDEYIYNHELINQYYIIAEDGNEGKAGAPDANWNPEKVRYRLPEDFRYYNQDGNMPNWYDLRLKSDQNLLEDSYIAATKEVFSEKDTYGEEILQMLKKIDSRIIDYNPSTVAYRAWASSANLYRTFNSEKHEQNAYDVLNGNHKINYYWKAVYHIEEKELQAKQTVHHVRMPALLVKYCDFWAKSVEYDNQVIQNPIDYKSYKHLIPESVNSLGVQKLDLTEKAKYRVETFKEYFNKADTTSGDASGDDGLKEADVMNMLVQWEETADKGR